MNNEELLSNYRQIKGLSETWVKKPPMTRKEEEDGLNASKIATAHPSEVPMTPWMKNMLRAFGDIAEDERLLADAPVTKAEKWLVDTCKQLLLEQSGKKHDHYDVSKPMRSVDHYYTDCWLNLDEKKLRDIQPGQVEEINDMILQNYARPTKALKIEQMMIKDVVFQKAIEVVMEDLPSVSATREIVEINLPFMTKHTNVGYKWFKNDRTGVPGTNQTYAQLTMDIAKGLAEKPEELWKWNVTEEFARYQRGKGRLIQAVSRVVNLVLNQLESVEIQNYKAKSPLFAGYNDANYLKEVLIQMLLESEEQGQVLYNIDYHRYDAHVCKEWLYLRGAIAMCKGPDKRTKKLAAYRSALSTKTWLISGTLGEVVESYGRIFSGFIDTNCGGGLINALNATYLVMLQDPHYVRDIAAKSRYRMLVMGDDNLIKANHNFSLQRFQKDAVKMNFEIDDSSKIAYGPKFLQYRVFEWHDKLVMIYPWTRVLRSMLFKERSAGLGPCGWTLAAYQQLSKLIEAPEFLAPVVNIIAAFDTEHLMLDKSVNDIIKGADLEDREAEKSDTRHVTTAERLYDGDPSKAQQFTPDRKLKPNFFQEVQDAIRAVYSPAYLSNHGIHTPKLK